MSPSGKASDSDSDMRKFESYHPSQTRRKRNIACDIFFKNSQCDNRCSSSFRKKNHSLWYARELQVVLDYKEWRKFDNVIEKAKIACKNTDISEAEHFVDADKLSKRANNAEVAIKDYKLIRYACYLIAQNGDSRKKVIASEKQLKKQVELCQKIYQHPKRA